MAYRIVTNYGSGDGNYKGVWFVVASQNGKETVCTETGCENRSYVRGVRAKYVAARPDTKFLVRQYLAEKL